MITKFSAVAPIFWVSTRRHSEIGALAHVAGERLPEAAGGEGGKAAAAGPGRAAAGRRAQTR
eukprot:4995534-Alexandrium_andersonii.AAC.1